MEFDSKEDQVAFAAIVKSISTEMVTMDDTRETIKDIVGAAASKFDIPKPMIRKVARLYHNKKAAEYEAETADVKSLYKSLSTS